jgi:helicase
MPEVLKTRAGEIELPAYLPVTTFGEKYPLDDLVRPYLPRLAQGVMVSYHYAKQMEEHEEPQLPLFVDSGGFASLRDDAEIVKKRDLGCIEIDHEDDTETVHPRDLLDLQEKVAEVAFTLDFPIPTETSPSEAEKRRDLTIRNAHWALANRRRKDLPLFASVQGWDVESYRNCAKEYAGEGFDGVAIGGLVPRSRDQQLITSIVQAVREASENIPVHIFGLGHPNHLEDLFEAGATSVDSSSYVQYAARGKLWGSNARLDDISFTDRLHIALCNLATATGGRLPLSSSQAFFSTKELAHQYSA